MRELLQTLTLKAAKSILVTIIEDEFNNPSDDHYQLSESDKDTLISWVNNGIIKLNLLESDAAFPLDEAHDTIADKIETVINADNAEYLNKLEERKELERKKDDFFNRGYLNEGHTYQNKLNNFIMPSRTINGDNCIPLMDKIKADFGILHNIASELGELIDQHPQREAMIDHLGDAAEAYGLETLSMSK